MKLKTNQFLLKRFIFCTVLGFILFQGLELKATHIVGGELNYRCLGNNNYEISLTVFRDCYNGNPAAYFDDPASIGIFDINDNLLTTLGQNGQLLIDLVHDDTLDPTLFDSCLVIPPNVCVHTTTYVETINLPPIAGGYQLAYQRCCRNQTILNIVDPLGTGATYYNYISELALQECNSSAVFKEWPPNYICVNEPIMFDHSAIDIDGDSLVYKLCTPFDGAIPDDPMPQPPYNPPYDSVVWVTPPYSLENMMGGVPLDIDPVTGLLTGTPNTIGQFVVGICVEEYRDGALISTTKRDFQYNVGQCGEAISSFFAPEVDCDGFTVNFENQSEDAVDFVWNFGDPTTNSDWSTLTNPSYVYPDTGLYEIMLIAGPNELCADTSYSYVSVQYPSLFVDFDLSIVDGCVFPAEVSFDDLSYDTISTIASWEWEFSDGTSSTDQNPVWYLTEPGGYTATLTVTAENGCVVSHTSFVSIDVLELGLQDTAYMCLGTSVQLNPNSNLTYGYSWSPEESLNNPSAASPTANPNQSTTYYVEVVDNEGCIYQDSVQVIVEDLIIDFENEIPICVGDTVQLHDGNESNLNYFWSPNINLINGNTGNPLAHPTEQISYYVTVTDINTGCDYQDTILVDPIIDVNIPDDYNICFGEDVIINQNGNPSFTYDWSPSATLNDPSLMSPLASPTQTTTYYTTIYDATSMCANLDSVTVVVNPLPFIPDNEITVCPGEEGALNPTGNSSFNYVWSPITGLNNPNIPNPIATINESMDYFVTITNPVTLCEYIDTVQVFVPPILEVNTSEDEIVCEPSLEISASSNTGISYQWYSDPTLTTIEGTGEVIEVSPGESSTYYVVATDAYGCTDIADVTVESHAVNIDIPPIAEVCEGDSLLLIVNNLNPNDILTYTWTPEENIISGEDTNSPLVFFNEDGLMTLIAENQYNCIDTFFIPVDVVENNLNIIATADPDSIYPGESSQLEATQGNGYSYQWTNVDILDDGTIYNPVASPLQTTTFDVFVVDDIGCNDTASVTVHLKTFFCEEPYIFVPNAFTPDGDGTNDIFYVRGNAIDEFYLAVYNRWGEKVFESNDLNSGWDGTYKGKKLPPDVFGYYVQLRCLNQEEFFKKGNVTLIR